MKIFAKFTESISTFAIKFSQIDTKMSADFGTVQTVTEYVIGDPYEGSYEVTPRIESQIMPTKGKNMADDVTIKEIPFFKVSNNSGGNTVYIGSEV